MNIEDQYILEHFICNFIDGRSNPIVIYGTGIHTGILLDNVKDERIVGLMDAKRTGEVVFGKKVLDYSEVAAVPGVIIVIIARNAVINVIYRRIEEFVKENDIKVYDINGVELKTDCFENTDKDCFSLSEENLKLCIDESEVVSFDIFDTLLCRRVMRPSDVFKIVDEQLEEKDYIFSEERSRAEGELEGLVAPTIDEIYARIGKNTNDSEKELQRIKKLEIETEKKLLSRREKMCELMQYAINQKKKVLLISDMYFSKDILENILCHFEIKGYDGLYVSCEYHATKGAGLYNIVKENENINGRWLHIGDNDYSDIKIPEKLGIDTFKIYGTTEMLEESIYSDILEMNTSMENNIVISQFAAVAFNNPFGGFNRKGKLYVEAPEQLSKLVCAPVIYKYMIWLVQKLAREEVDFVFFPSRDGYILKKIYDSICKLSIADNLPEGAYFYTSRRASMVASVETLDDIIRISDFPGETAPDLRAKKRFEMDNDDVGYMSEEFIAKAFDRGRLEHDNYMVYMDKHNYRNHKKIAMVDFVAVGTIHEALQKLFEKNIKGYYFLRRRPDTEYRKKMDIDSLYGIYGDYQTAVNIYTYYYFMEMIVTSYEPSLRYFDSEGNPCFYKESRSDEVLDIIKRMHNGIYEYCADILPLVYHFEQWNESVSLYDKLLGLLSKNYMDIVPGIIDIMENVDEFLEKRVTEINR